jgi:hypothetical protein
MAIRRWQARGKKRMGEDIRNSSRLLDPAESADADGKFRLVLLEIAVYVFMLCGLIATINSTPMHVS